MARTYSDAIASLNSLQTNFAIVDAIRKSGRKMNEQAIPEMVEWCRKIGYQPSDFDKLNTIHIAGTKGKGSTSAFISSILTKYLGTKSTKDGRILSKVGLYTSPHLRFVRERIQINGEPLSEEKFARYFFEIWDRLERAAEETGQDPKASGTKPVYFRFLTLMAFHTYVSEGVSAAVIECGIGAAYDSTNVLQRPSVTGITSLGIDHVGVLGATLGEIAWHKAGVIKVGAKCFTTTSQLPEAKEVLNRVAQEVGSELVYVDVDQRITTGQIQLGLEAEFQKTNASLALAISKDWLQKHGYDSMDDNDSRQRQGLQDVKWSGRCETRYEKNLTWYIDGGHTLESINLAGQWYAATQKERRQTHAKRYLVFNQQTRDANALAHALHSTLATTLQDSHPFTHTIFCTNTTFRDTGYRPDLVSTNTNASDVEALTVQRGLAETWKKIDSEAEVSVVRTIEEAVDLVRLAASTQEQVTAFVTGSLHLVGGFLEVIESDKP
ncbi:hypothetical protein LTS08_005103 [Lithohypha guttulata]|uniref:Folylpolyglutamate synthase n=1 Tax=Lithohypha guttulata TaxID=1690604 RepID=A0AAN7YF90_9EURO|nr:hypothetical protein LTR51_004730 [Lithohypha guttulata]KAK5091337.1 hypothetical protein LTR05_001520 [Lithohypha guttulata]KAK5100354.1 hypothetical protein LTS08_005103 [Lithohypha guttulata]